MNKNQWVELFRGGVLTNHLNPPAAAFAIARYAIRLNYLFYYCCLP